MIKYILGFLLAVTPAQGKIFYDTLIIRDGNEGISGECFISSDTTGSGNWDTCPASGITGTGTDERLIRWDTTTDAQDSAVSLDDNGAMIVPAQTAGTVPLTARGFTAQSARLFEWQDVTPTTLGGINFDGTIDAPNGATNALAYGFVSEASAGMRFDSGTPRLLFEFGTTFGLDSDGTHLLGGGQLFTADGSAAMPDINIGLQGGTAMGIYKSGASDYTLVNSTNDILEIEASRAVLHEELDPDVTNTIDLGTTGNKFRNAHFNLVRTDQVNLSAVGNSNLIMLLNRTSPSGATVSGMEGFAGFLDLGTHTGNNTVANAQSTGNVIEDTGNITNAGASGDTGSYIWTPGTNAGSGLVGDFQIKSKTVVTVGGLVATKVTGDPCGDTDLFPEGSQFYNDTSNYYCFCDGTNDVQMHDPSTACF